MVVNQLAMKYSTNYDRQIGDLLTLQGELKSLLLAWKSLSKKPKDAICPNIQ